jgi:hypothetical protein
MLMQVNAQISLQLELLAQLLQRYQMQEAMIQHGCLV